MRGLIALCFVLLCEISFAGTQVRFLDYFIHGGDTLVLSNRPLDPYFRLYPELMPVPEKPFLDVNNQYTAVFEVIDSALYLTAIYTDKADTNNIWGLKNLISDVFAGQKEVRMDWFSAILVFGTSLVGPKRVYGNQKDDDFYIMKIQEGRLTSIKNSTAKKVKRLKHQLFKEFSNSPEYVNLINERFSLSSDIKPKQVEKRLGDEIYDYSSQVVKEKTPHNNE